MENYKFPLIILGLILIAIGVVLFTLLRFWGIIALVVGFIALARAFTLKSTGNKKEEPQEEVVEAETEDEPEEEGKLEFYDAEDEELEEAESGKEDIEEESKRS